MQWCNPVIVDLSVDTKGQRDCKDGGAPKYDCDFGGVKHGTVCDRGSYIPPCLSGDAGFY